MGNQLLVTDSINAIQQTIEVNTPLQEKSIIDIFCSVSTVVIAIVNVFLLIYFFIQTRRKDDNNNEKNRKISLLKTLVLDYNMKYLYQFFDEIQQKVENLKNGKMTDKQKMETNAQLIDFAKVLRQKFIVTLIAIDKKLYDEILRESDILLDSITKSIFDEGIVLSYEPKFEELITNKVTEAKTKMIKILFNYSGV